MLIQRARSSKQSPHTHTHTTLRQSSRSPSRFPTNKTNTGSQNKRPCTHKTKATHANKQSPHTSTLSPHLNHLFPKTRPITPLRGAICLVVAFFMSPSPKIKEWYPSCFIPRRLRLRRDRLQKYLTMGLSGLCLLSADQCRYCGNVD